MFSSYKGNQTNYIKDDELLQVQRRTSELNLKTEINKFSK